MHRLGGKGRGYGDDLKKAVDVTVKAGVEAAVNASDEKDARHQKPRWETGRDLPRT